MPKQVNLLVFQLKKQIEDIKNYNRDWNYSSDFERMVQTLNDCSQKLGLPEFKFEHFHYSSSGKTINPTGYQSLINHISIIEQILSQSIGNKDNNSSTGIHSGILKDDRIKVNNNKKVFIVHGRDKQALLEVEGIVRRAGLEPIILSRMPNSGLTLIEKFEKYADVKYAVVLLTPDDVGALFEDLPIQSLQYQFRARQNVVFELGFFYGKLGRSNVCCIHKASLELPTDINGIAYIPFNESVEEVEFTLLKEFKEAGLEIQTF